MTPRKFSVDEMNVDEINSLDFRGKTVGPVYFEMACNIMGRFFGLLTIYTIIKFTFKK